MDGLVVVGVLAFVVGLLASIALHEIGHLVPAKLFGVKVTQYMVGFGRTVWSRRRGETEYGVKAIPLGGYVRMIGMFPPEPGDDPRRLRTASTGPFQALIEDARRAAKVEIQPGDEDRVFYRQPWWKKLIVMLGGPLMNVIIAVVLAGTVLMTFGVAVAQTTVSSVSECVIPVEDGARECEPADPLTPAAQAGFQPGDRLVSFNGTPITRWDEASGLIRAAGAGPVTVVVERDGAMVTLRPDLIETERPADPSGLSDELVTVGFLGVAPTVALEKQDALAAVGWVGDFTATMARAIVGIPQRMVGVWQAAFGGAERDPMSPVGIVGAGRIGGEIAALDAPAAERVATFVMLLASFNMAIALFNLIPLLPLDGGHAAGAVWEGIKRGWAKVTRGPTPRPVDVAKALPLAYGMAALLIGMAVLLLYADIVNPIRLTG
jgi:membrane-associated protease RseP (regulator of RpoE activity)